MSFKTWLLESELYEGSMRTALAIYDSKGMRLLINDNPEMQLLVNTVMKAGASRGQDRGSRVVVNGNTIVARVPLSGMSGAGGSQAFGILAIDGSSNIEDIHGAADWIIKNNKAPPYFRSGLEALKVIK